jgi:hypothetical protein
VKRAEILGERGRGRNGNSLKDSQGIAYPDLVGKNRCGASATFYIDKHIELNIETREKSLSSTSKNAKSCGF